MEAIPPWSQWQLCDQNIQSVSLWTWGITFINFSRPQLQKKPLSVIENSFFVRILIHRQQNPHKQELEGVGAGLSWGCSFIYIPLQFSKSG